jgi:predicted methyltransferase
MIRTTMLAALAAVTMTTAAVAGAVPAYISKAVADTHRPAKDKTADSYRKPADMVVFAGIKPGDTVVDLIPGGGYFTRIFSKTVGAKGHVYAYQPKDFDSLYKHGIPVNAIAADPAYKNVSVIHKPLKDFATPTKVNVVWTSQNYHDIHNLPDAAAVVKAMNKGIYDSLKPGGVFIVLDHRAKAGTGTADTHTMHRIDPAVVKKEVEAAGFKYVESSDVLANPTDQFIFKFEKPKM